MAPLPTFVKRLAVVLAIVALASGSADLKVRTTSDKTTADLRVRTTSHRSSADLQVGLMASLKARTTIDTQAPGTTTIPRRIISLVPATTEMLFVMGAGSRIAGVSNYDRFPPEVEKLPKVGGLIDPNVERLISLKPDLVIVYDTQTDLKQQLERARIPMFRYVHRGLPDITETLRALGERVGAKAAADTAANRIEQQLAAIRARVAGRLKPTTLLVFGRDPGALRHIDASAGYGFLHDALELAGGTDVLADLKQQSADVSSEMILQRAPQVILELHYGESLKREHIEDERRVWNVLASVPAVKNNRVYLLTGDEFVIPGPRIVIAVDRFARTLHPDAFPK